MLSSQLFHCNLCYLIVALHMAAANGHLSIVEFLISKGVVRYLLVILPAAWVIYFSPLTNS